MAYNSIIEYREFVKLSKGGVIMKFRKLVVGAITLAVMTVSCSPTVCFAQKDADKPGRYGVDEKTFSVISETDDVLNNIMKNDFVITKSDAADIAGLLAELNALVKDSDEVSQIHCDIVFKTDYVFTCSKSETDFSEVFNQLDIFCGYAASVSSRSAAAVG